MVLLIFGIFGFLVLEMKLVGFSEDLVLELKVMFFLILVNIFIDGLINFMKLLLLG